jgi:hypothetical protein
MSSDSANNYFGANASIGVHRSIKNGGFSFSVSQAAGESSGIGTVSQNQQATLGMNHTLGRYASFSLDFSAFNTRDRTPRQPRWAFPEVDPSGFPLPAGGPQTWALSTSTTKPIPSLIRTKSAFSFQCDFTNPFSGDSSDATFKSIGPTGSDGAVGPPQAVDSVSVYRFDVRGRRLGLDSAESL